MKDPAAHLNKQQEKDNAFTRRYSANYSLLNRHNRNSKSPSKLLKQADLNVKNMLSSILDSFPAEDKDNYPIEQTLQIISESKNFNYNQPNLYSRDFLTKQISNHNSDDDNQSDSIDFVNVNLNKGRNKYNENDEMNRDSLDHLRRSLIMKKKKKLLMTVLPINALPFENKYEYKELITESCKTIKSYKHLYKEIKNSLFPKFDGTNYCVDENEPSPYMQDVKSEIHEHALKKSTLDIEQPFLQSENCKSRTTILGDNKVKKDYMIDITEPQQTQRSGNINNNIKSEQKHSQYNLFINSVLTRSTHSLQQPLLQLQQQLQQKQLAHHRRGSTSSNLILSCDNLNNNNNSSIINNTALINNSSFMINNNIPNTNISSTLVNKHNIATNNTISETFTREEDLEDPKEGSSLLKEQLLKEKELKFRRCFRKTQLVYDSLSDTEEEDLINEDEYIFIHPTSITRSVLDLFILISTFIFLFISPLEIAFIHNLSFFIFEIAIMNGIAEIIYINDVIFSFLTAYIDNYNDRLITQPSLMAKNYLYGWFFFDLIVAFPINFHIDFYMYKNPNGIFTKETFLFYNNDISNMKYVHLLKLLKLLKLYKIACDNIILSSIFDKAIHSRAGQNLLLIITLLLFIIFLHIFACVFIFLGYNTYPSWITNLNLHPSSYLKIYIASFYEQTLTILGVGYGDIQLSNTNERLFSLFPLSMGVLIYSWLVSTLGKFRNKEAINAVLYEKNPKALECLHKLDKLEMIRSEYKEIKHSFYKKIYRYLKSYLEKEKFNPNAIFSNLPLKLQKELLFAMYKPIIENFIFFKYFPNEDFIMTIILCLKPTVCIKNERIVQVGDVMEEIIFVKKGKLALEMPLPHFISQQLSQTRYLNKIAFTFKNKISTKTTIKSIPTVSENANEFLIDENCQFVKLIELRKNEHYGDVVMFLNRRSHLSVRVSSKTAELFYLSKPDAVSIALRYPDIWGRIIVNSMKNLRQINNLSNKALEFFYQTNKVVLSKLLKQNEQYIHEIQQKEKDLILLKKKKKKKKLSTADIVSYFGMKKNANYQKIDSGNENDIKSNQNTNSNNNSFNNNIIDNNDNQCESSNINSSSSNHYQNSRVNNADTISNSSSQVSQRSQLISDASSRGLMSNHNNNNNFYDNNETKLMSSMLRKLNSSKTKNIDTNNKDTVPLSQRNNEPPLDQPPLLFDYDDESVSKQLFYNNKYNFPLIVNDELYDGESLLHIHRKEISRCRSAELSKTLIEENKKLHYHLPKVKSLFTSNESTIISKLPNMKHNKSIKPTQTSLIAISPTSPTKVGISKIKTSKPKFTIQCEQPIFDTTIKLIVPPTGGNVYKNHRKTTTNIDIIPLINNKKSIRDTGIKNSVYNIDKKKTKTRMDIIATNIENSCLNLNDPKSFYSEKFKAMIRKGGDDSKLKQKHNTHKLHTMYQVKRNGANSIDLDEI